MRCGAVWLIYSVRCECPAALLLYVRAPSHHTTYHLGRHAGGQGYSRHHQESRLWVWVCGVGVVCVCASVWCTVMPLLASAGQVEAEVLDKLDNLLQAGWGDDEYKETFADM